MLSSLCPSLLNAASNPRLEPMGLKPIVAKACREQQKEHPDDTADPEVPVQLDRFVLLGTRGDFPAGNGLDAVPGER